MRKIIFSIILLVGILFIGNSVSAKTLYDCYQSKGLKWESSQSRALSGIPAENGVFKYKGTAEQNTALSERMCGADGLLGFSVVTGYKQNLSSPMTASQSSVPVSSLLTKDNHTLTMADLGNEVFLTIEPGGVKEEIVKCTNIIGSSFAGCTRGLAFYGSSTVSIADNTKTHNAGSTVVMSNVHYVYEQYVDTNNKDQTIQGNLIYRLRPWR